MVDIVSGAVRLLLPTGDSNGLSVTDHMLHMEQVVHLEETVREVAMVVRVL